MEHALFAVSGFFCLLGCAALVGYFLGCVQPSSIGCNSPYCIVAIYIFPFIVSGGLLVAGGGIAAAHVLLDHFMVVIFFVISGFCIYLFFTGNDSNAIFDEQKKPENTPPVSQPTHKKQRTAPASTQEMVANSPNVPAVKNAISLASFVYSEHKGPFSLNTITFYSYWNNRIMAYCHRVRSIKLFSLTGIYGGRVALPNTGHILSVHHWLEWLKNITEGRLVELSGILAPKKLVDRGSGFGVRSVVFIGDFVQCSAEKLGEFAIEQCFTVQADIEEGLCILVVGLNADFAKVEQAKCFGATIMSEKTFSKLLGIRV